MKEPTKRFSDRVANYIKYRPQYPEAALDCLITEGQLNADSIIADIGSGTGILTSQLLSRGLTVQAVEPNKEMREMAEVRLGPEECFTSISGRAESTGLSEQSVDLIVAAQAFHWFALDKTKTEFLRILKHGGKLALLWNRRKLSQPFQASYHSMLQQLAPEYSQSNHMNLSDHEIQSFYGGTSMKKYSFEHVQHFGLSSFLGRMQSSSYTPAPSSPEFTPLLEAAAQLFEEHAVDNKVAFEYESTLYLGTLEL